MRGSQRRHHVVEARKFGHQVLRCGVFRHQFACFDYKLKAGSGTLATHDALFIGLLIGTVLLVGALTFIPALALGPLAEHFSLL